MESTVIIAWFRVMLKEIWSGGPLGLDIVKSECKWSTSINMQVAP